METETEQLVMELELVNTEQLTLHAQTLLVALIYAFEYGDDVGVK